MEQVTRPGGLFAIFRIVQYLPYIAIGLLVIMITLWVVFCVKKLRWAKALAIILTVLVVITGLLSFTPYIMGAILGRQLPMGGFPGNGEPPAGNGQQFRDFRERQNNQDLQSEYKPFIDFENMEVFI